MISKYLRFAPMICLAMQLVLSMNPETDFESNKTSRTYKQETSTREINADENGSISLRNGQVPTAQITVRNYLRRYALPIVGLGVIVLIGGVGAKKKNLWPFEKKKESIPLKKKVMLRPRPQNKNNIHLYDGPETSNNRTMQASENIRPTQIPKRRPDIQITPTQERRRDIQITPTQERRPDIQVATTQERRPDIQITTIQERRPDNWITDEEAKKILERAAKLPKYDHIFLNYQHIDGDINYADNYKIIREERSLKQIHIELFNQESSEIYQTASELRGQFQDYWKNRSIRDDLTDQSTTKAHLVPDSQTTSDHDQIEAKIMEVFDVNQKEFMEKSRREFIRIVEEIRFLHWNRITEIKDAARNIPGNPLQKILEEMDQCEEKLKAYKTRMLFFGPIDEQNAFPIASEYATVTRKQLVARLDQLYMIRKYLDETPDGDAFDCMNKMAAHEMKIFNPWAKEHQLKGDSDVATCQVKCKADILECEDWLKTGDKAQIDLLRWLEMAMNHNDLVNEMDGHINSLTAQFKTNGWPLVPEVDTQELSQQIKNIRNRLKTIERRIRNCKQCFENNRYESLKTELDKLNQLFTQNISPI